jgi:hypothetical protein
MYVYISHHDSLDCTNGMVALFFVYFFVFVLLVFLVTLNL